jgi:hypothetical protein
MTLGVGVDVGRTVGATDGAADPVALLAAAEALGAALDLVPVQAATKAAKPASAVPCTNLRRVMTDRWEGCCSLIGLLASLRFAASIHDGRRSTAFVFADHEGVVR